MLLLFLLFLLFCCSDWPSTGLASNKKFRESIIKTGNFYHGVAICSDRQFRFHWTNHSDLWKDLFLLQKLTIDYANFSQKWTKGQGTSWPVTDSTDVSGLKKYDHHQHPLIRELLSWLGTCVGACRTVSGVASESLRHVKWSHLTRSLICTMLYLALEPNTLQPFSFWHQFFASCLHWVLTLSFQG